LGKYNSEDALKNVDDENDGGDDDDGAEKDWPLVLANAAPSKFLMHLAQ